MHLICHKGPVCFLSFSQSGRTEILGSVAECYGEPPPLSGLPRPSGPNEPTSLNRPIYHPPSNFATSTPSHCKGEIRVGRRESRFESRVEKRERLSVSQFKAVRDNTLRRNNYNNWFLKVSKRQLLTEVPRWGVKYS